MKNPITRNWLVQYSPILQFNNASTKCCSKQAVLKMLLILLISIFNTHFTISQEPLIGCGVNENNTCRRCLPHPTCEIENREPKCVRIKFHHINNTNGASTSPTDEEFARLLEWVNRDYEKAKIRFDFDGQCVHRESISSDINTSIELIDLIGADASIPDITINDVTFSEEEGCKMGVVPFEVQDPDLGYLENYINVYFVQDLNSLPSGFYGLAGVVVIESPPAFNSVATLIHEIGHVMGLNHTFSNYAPGQTIPASDDCLCKDPAALNALTSIPHCQSVQDCLCDTGMDPIALDLDDNTIADGPDRWVVDGIQISELTPSIADWCGDITTPWDLPVTNFMSYYRAGRSFSMCQMALMHDVLDENIPHFLMECDEEDPFIFCQDIIISSDITLSSGSKELCRNQEIIIARGGSLTLDDYLLTIAPLPDPPSGSCPDLVPTELNTWKGIRLDNDLDPESSPNPPELHLTNGSTIEYADLAISSPDYDGPITITNSFIRNCGGILEISDYDLISSIGDGVLSVTGADIGCSLPLTNSSNEIQILGCEFSVDDAYSAILPYKTDQIDLNGVSLTMAGTEIVNNTSKSLVAIKSARGRVYVNNGSSISSFSTGIVKNLDVLNLCSPRGLDVRNSNFLDGSSVSNYSTYLLIRDSKFEGSISSRGFTNGAIASNRVTNYNNLISNPTRSVVIKENLFDNSYFDFSGNNTLTNSLCNTWNNSEYAFEASVGTTQLIGSWGSTLKPSGNKNNNSPRPDMYFNGSGSPEFFNYYINTTQYLFEYVGLAAGRIAAGTVTDCAYNYPITTPIFNSEWRDTGEDLVELDEDYIELLEDIADLSEDLGQLIGSDTISKHTHIIGQNRVELYDLVRRATKSMTLDDSIYINDWVDRIAPFQLTLSQYLVKWYESDFDFLKTELFSNPDADAEVLYEAASFMDDIIGVDRNIFTLNQTQLDSLLILAESSYGDYTNILRTFLDSEYDLNIVWPGSIAPRYSSQDEKASSEKNNLEDTFNLSPNPTKGCFSISSSKIDQDIIVEIFDIQGRLVTRNVGVNEIQICLRENSGLYFAVIQNSITGTTETKKVLLKRN